MNKKLSLKKSVVLVATVSLISVPLMAKPIMKKITAYLNPAIEYAYDGKEILDDVNSITYGNKTYVPVSEFAKALGKDVNYKNGKIIVTSKEEVEDAKQITIEKATIKAINKESKQIAILPAGKEDKHENYIVLNIGADTLLRHEKLKKVVVLDDLKVGMEVKVSHSLVTTSSIPPQTKAFEVVIKEDATPSVGEQNYKVSMGIVKEVNAGGNQVTILPVGQKDSYENYVVLNVSDKTLLKNEKQDKLLNLKDLSVGMKVKAVHSSAATFSLPPQTPTYKIIVIDKWDTDNDKDDDKDDDKNKKDYDLEDAVIKEINHAEKYLVVVEADKEYKVIFTNKTKVEYEKGNKKPNVNSLKVGQIVDIEVEDGVAEEIEVQH